MRPRRKKFNEKSLRIIGIPKKFFNKTIDDFETDGEEDLEKIKKFFSDYIKNISRAFEKNKGLYLYGSNGVGKSMLTSIVAKECYISRYTVKRITFLDYINEYTKMWGIKDSDERDIAEEYFYDNIRGAEFLILEEIGKENESKVNVNILEDLLRYREDNSLVTIICTNLKLSEMQKKYGDSIFSLVRGNMTPIKIELKDKREKEYRER